ncbi:MAG TPA: peptidyl-alpha-hydroxyglycine alpha-amidating lyase family protein [Vicinamibacterales bacterium]|nr:peptidyl-alpha-hydroxyglycine alpha-amidating lyase family protein [Vicinamibacterales bacterium]
MRALIRLFVSAAAVVLLGGASLFAQTKATAENVPTIPYTSVPNFFKLPPDLYLGEGIGIATNSKGHIFIYHRSSDTRLFEFDATGTFVKEWGVGLYGIEFAHQVRVDPQDNVWVVDEGTNMVIKFNPAGRVAMVFGRRPEPVAGATQTQNAQNPSVLDRKYGFGRPTDVTWDPQGNIFVSDGYVNSRVVKLDKNGRFLGQFAGGERGEGKNQLNTPHSITSDAQGNIYVGDRGNRRIVVLNNDLTLKTTYTNVGNPWAVCISPGPHQYLYSSNSNPDANPAASWAITGEIYKMELDGRIIGKFGKAGKGLGEFSTVHEIDCRNPDQLFVSEISAWRAQKLILNPSKIQPASSSSAR